MAHWVVGDVHGCWATLQQLLSRISWDPRQDTLWFVGDLVNKGAGSLEVLRWAVANRNSVEMVLGNHDVHLLARAAGCVKKRRGDTLDDVFDAPDRGELLGWLRRRPFLLERGGTVLVHAGLLPSWSLETARELVRCCETAVRADGGDTIADLVRRARQHRKSGLKTASRVPAVMTVLTTIRVVDEEGEPVYGFDGGPDERPPGTRAWFEASVAANQADLVVFGHWANLGFFAGERAMCLDTGCVYGGELCALRVDDRKIVRVGCAAEDRLV